MLDFWEVSDHHRNRKYGRTVVGTIEVLGPSGGFKEPVSEFLDFDEAHRQVVV